MKGAAKFSLILVTALDLKTARNLAQGALKARLAACANIVPRIESHYWWQGKIEHARECLILFKTTTARLGALEKFILSKHPYDTPEFLVLKLTSGNTRYLSWLEMSVSNELT